EAGAQHGLLQRQARGGFGGTRHGPISARAPCPVNDSMRPVWNAGTGSGQAAGTRSEQAQLRIIPLRLAEVLRRQARARGVQPEPLARDLEATAEHPGVRPGALHARTPLRVVVLAVAGVAHELHHVAIAVGIVRHQPFAEKVAHLERQAQQHVARFLDAGDLRRLEDALHLAVVERRDDRRDHHRRRHAGVRQLPQGLEAPHRRRRARLHLARQLGVERRHRQRDLRQLALGHAGEDVDVAQHQRRFGDDADRMAGTLQHFEDAAHHLIFALDRLVRVGVGADGDDLRLVGGRGQFLLQQFRRLRLHEQLRLEIEARRQAEIGVRRPRETVDAAVLAAAIGIDRPVEADVGTVVAGDDLARRVRLHDRLERRQIVERAPAVVEGDARVRLEAPHGVRLRAAAAAALMLDDHAEHVADVLIDAAFAARRCGGQLLNRRASRGCVRTSHAFTLARRCERNKNIFGNRHDRAHLPRFCACRTRRHWIWRQVAGYLAGSMLTVSIPTRESERALVQTLAPLVAGATAGLIAEVIIADAGSKDATAEVADLAGCRYLAADAPTGARLKSAAQSARTPWMLFLRPGTVPETGWVEAVEQFIGGSEVERAAVFRRRADEFTEPGIAAAVAAVR